MPDAPDPWNDPQPEDRQFSLLGLFVLITVLSLALAPVAWLPPQVFAGVLGFVAFVSLCLISWLNPRRAIVTITWWCLLALYVIAAVVAATQMGF